jgi:hypothetical protein
MTCQPLVHVPYAYDIKGRHERHDRLCGSIFSHTSQSIGAANLNQFCWGCGRRPWRFQNRGSPSVVDLDEPPLWNEGQHTHLHSFFVGPSYRDGALVWAEGRTGGHPHTGSLQAAKEAESKVTNVPEVPPDGDAAMWTHVTFSFVGHENIYKSQRTIMRVLRSL